MSNVLETTLLEWAATRNDEVVFNPRDGYYSFSIVADAFEKGKSTGKSEWLSDLRKKYVEGLKIAAQVMNELVDSLKRIDITVRKGFIHNSINETEILLTVDENTYLDSHFIKNAFVLASRIHHRYFEEGKIIQISYIDETDDLNYKLQRTDGYDFMYDFIKGKLITE
jgi:hypothetical protein